MKDNVSETATPDGQRACADSVDRRPIPGVRAICGNVERVRTSGGAIFALVLVVLLVLGPVTIGLTSYMGGWGLAIGVAIFAGMVYGVYRANLATFRDRAHARIRRLDAVLQHPAARTRLPHRVLERRLLQDGLLTFAWRIRRLGLPPGPAIVVGVRPSQTWLADVSPVVGEPLSLKSDLQLITTVWLSRDGWLPAATLANPQCVLPEDAAVVEESDRAHDIAAARRKFRRQQIFFWGSNAFLVLWFLGSLFLAAGSISITGEFVRESIMLPLIVGSLFIFFFSINRGRWVAPGAFIHCGIGLFRRFTAHVYSPTNSRLIIWTNLLKNRTVIVNKKKARQFSEEMPQTAGTQIALALFWASAANQPRAEQLAAFFGEDVRVEFVRPPVS